MIFMAKKADKDKEETPVKTSEPKKPGEKLILYEAVQAYPIQEFIMMGALSRAGLIDQYRYEEYVYQREVIKPSITVDELTKIIKDFLGE